MLGSVAIVAAGIGGLALIGRDDPTARSSASTDASVTMPSEQTIGWQCSGQLDQFERRVGFDDQNYTYWASCERVALGDEVGIVLLDPVPTTAPAVVDAPFPSMPPCEEPDGARGSVSVPCPTQTSVPSCDATDPACAAVTSPALDPTTTVPNGAVTDRDGRRVILHYVRSGDNPSRIAALWGITVEELDATNTNNPYWETFAIGGEIWVPESGRLPTELPSTASIVDPSTMTLPLDQPVRIELGTHCGVRVLGQMINGHVWRTDEASVGGGDWLPAEWMTDPTRPDGPLAVTVALRGDGTSLTATLNDRTVVYNRGGETYEDTDLCE